MKIIIVGGGVIGLMQARELAQRGLEVVIIEKGQLGKEASWAGGGIISPLYPWRYSDPISELASWSQGYYPELIDHIHGESGIDPELSAHGLLMLSVEDQDDAISWSSKFASWLEPITQSTIYDLEPNLKEGCQSALWMEKVASVRNPRLLRALKKIVKGHEKIEVMEQTSVNGLVKQNGRVMGVSTSDGGRLLGDKILFCSGAWTSGLLAGTNLDVHPVRGQMIVFDACPGLINRVVLSDGKYLIPRRDGRVVVGSTMEYTEFDKSTTEQAREQLKSVAFDLVPGLRDYPISHHWAGLRPGSPKGIPYIGSLDEHENVYINAGHFRNGLVLAPASVRLATSLLCNDAHPFDPAAYRINAPR